MRWILIILFMLVVGFGAYVRMAPINQRLLQDPVMARDPGDYPDIGGFTTVRVMLAPAGEVMRTLEGIALRTPRTKLIAGSNSDESMTFETRSRVIGFPDYTTVSIIPKQSGADGTIEPLLMIHGRLRFGKSDLGVNKARIEDWVSQLGALLAAP